MRRQQCVWVRELGALRKGGALGVMRGAGAGQELTAESLLRAWDSWGRVARQTMSSKHPILTPPSKELKGMALTFYQVFIFGRRQL